MVDVTVSNLAIALFFLEKKKEKDRSNSHSGEIEREAEFHMIKLIAKWWVLL